jgi:nitrous oxidase accessory protein NosD
VKKLPLFFALCLLLVLSPTFISILVKSINGRGIPNQINIDGGNPFIDDGSQIAFQLNSQILLATSNEGNSSTWTVDDDGPADFSTIQEAVDAASDGDNIQVRSGIYNEHVSATKSLTFLGEGRNSIIDGNGTGIIIEIIADNVSINGFTLRNAGYGIYPGRGSEEEPGPTNITIADNTIEFCGTGIFSGAYHEPGLGYVEVLNNTFRTNSRSIDWNSGTAIVIGNTFAYNTYGIFLEGGAAEIRQNFVCLSTVCGVWVQTVPWGLSYNITNNYVWNNNHGINILGYGDQAVGTVYGNIVRDNVCGVYINPSEEMEDSHLTSIYKNNFVDNIQQVFYNSPLTTITWDKGYDYGGNYWSDYGGVDFYSGPAQDSPSSDGFGDTPYIIDESHQDNYPFMQPLSLFLPSPNMPLPPVARYSFTPTAPFVLEEITFDASESHDLDGNIASYNWDFGDGNTTSTIDPVINHVYESAANQTVTLSVTDNDGLTVNETKKVNISKINSEISLTASSQSITIFGNISIQGAITPARGGVNVSIWHRIPGETGWAVLTQVETSVDGGYAYVWVPSAPSSYELGQPGMEMI